MQEISETFWLWQLLGRLHPLIVHFPLSLLCVALLVEVISWRRPNNEYRAGITLMVRIGAISSVVAVVFGLLLANQEEYSGDIVTIHQWSGLATMALSFVTLLALRTGRMALYRSMLALTVVGVTVAGHYGALLTHGEDYITSVLPLDDEQESPRNTATVFTFASNSTNGPLTVQQVEDLNLEVRSILAHNCYSCHSATKTKGELRLDKKELVMKGGESGPVIVANHPEDSELIRRITLPAGHKEAMPTKGKRLTEKEVAILEFWIKQGAPWPSGAEKSIYKVAALEPRLPTLPPATNGLTNPVDRFVNSYFQKNNVSWQQVVDDRTYIRRVFLDVVGLLPPPEKVQAFVADTRPDKREVLVKEMLNRNEDYAQHWLTFWNDALRNDYTGTGYITGGRFDITRWLYSSLKTNKPYNWFVRELISPTKESEGFIKGIKWRGTINSSQRTEMQAAQNVSQVLLGLNLKCASCHDSFISDWKLEDAYAFANVFADSTLEINHCDKPTGKVAGRRILFKELGEISVDAPTEQRLRELADFLVQPKDGRLYRTLVNRIWAQLMGRGIVEPVDMMDNAPWSQDLLDYLAYDFVQQGYDIRKLLYTILTSRTYQLPSVGVQEAELLMAPDYVFKGMVRRRLTAEQFADAVSVAFNPLYADSAIVYKRLPETIQQEIPFVRAALVKNDPFLTALGRPNRETVSTARTSQANLLQALELTNGDKLNQTLKAGAERWRTQYPATDALVRELYRKALGREPSAKELAVAEKMLGKSPSVTGVQDLAWAIVLHPEFQLIF
ncbi:DUF1549 domain-containing protein [Telluribacter sp. SYSU D00476]|uniref:DUF1549 domain-containing protein n=1 Tax=Telluribacter sp. SYSU D00476 TaxID=2811430 RepID=UPI001FF5F950|nr:DUF1549 domain-containing protein [Telluribacter sp. SYSU D00476]